MKDTVIITHPAKSAGEAHFDEVTAIALIAPLIESNITVLRKDPTEDELNNPDIFVIDVGGRYEPSLKNFDHHQDKSLDSSFVLVARYLKIEEKCEAYFPWWESMNILDAKGPYELASSLNSDIGTIGKLQNPIADHLVSLTITNNEYVLNTVVQHIRAYGKYLHDSISSMDLYLQLLTSAATLVKVKNLNILFTDHMIPSPAFRLYKKLYADFDISVSRNARNNSLSAYRDEEIKDKIDFLILENHPKIKFVHKNGFLMAAQPEVTMVEFLELIKLCILI